MFNPLVVQFVKKIIEQKMTALAKIGRNSFPTNIDFTTYTLRYNKMHWVQIDSLEEHWKPARIGIGFDPEGLYSDDTDQPCPIRHPTCARLSAARVLEAARRQGRRGVGRDCHVIGARL